VAIFCVFALVGVTLAFENEEHASLWEFVMAGGLAIAALRGMCAFVSGGQVQVQARWSGSWVTQFMASFVALVMTTGYTAVVTTGLLSKSRSKYVTFEDAIQDNLRFCVHGIIIKELLARHRSLYPHQLVPVESSNKTKGWSKSEMELMDEGECDAAILGEDRWYAARRLNSTHCKSKVVLAESVASFMVGMPVRDVIAQSVSWRLADHVQKGLYHLAQEEAKANYTGHVCDPLPMSDGERKNFDLGSMLGPLVLLAFVAFASLIVTRIGRRAQRTSDQLKSAIDMDRDGDVSQKEIALALKSELRRRSHQASVVARAPSSAALKAVKMARSAGRPASGDEPPSRSAAAESCPPQLDAPPSDLVTGVDPEQVKWY
jgi:hypothetical protein